MPARLGKSQVDVGLFAGDQQQLRVRQPPAFVEHRLHFLEPDRARVLGVAVTVKFGQMNHLHPHVLEHPDEVGRGARRTARFLLEGRHGDGHVEMAGERVVAGK